MGVSWKTRDKLWLARIGFNRKRVQIGYFATKQEALAAYDDYLAKLGPLCRTPTYRKDKWIPCLENDNATLRLDLIAALDQGREVVAELDCYKAMRETQHAVELTDRCNRLMSERDAALALAKKCGEEAASLRALLSDGLSIIRFNVPYTASAAWEDVRTFIMHADGILSDTPPSPSKEPTDV